MSRKAKAPAKVKRREKSELRGRMTNFLMFLPNMVRLLGRLLKDARVPTAEKALFVAAIVYFISPVRLSTSSPTVFSETVLPPVFGPVITMARVPGLGSTSIGTTV